LYLFLPKQKMRKKKMMKARDEEWEKGEEDEEDWGDEDEDDEDWDDEDEIGMKMKTRTG
jgi:hypothetical protein